MDNLDLNIALLPDNKTSDLAIRMSKELNENFPTNFVLNDTNSIPHLTIYQAQFPIKNVEEVKRQTELLFKNVSSFDMRLDEFSTTPQGNVWWNSEDPEPMRTFQKEAIELCNSLREGLILPGLEELLTTRGPEYRDEIRNYGSLWIGKRYSPHISLTAINPTITGQVLRFLGEGQGMGFKAGKIVIGHLGKYGTVTKIIKVLEL